MQVAHRREDAVHQRQHENIKTDVADIARQPLRFKFGVLRRKIAERGRHLAAAFLALEGDVAGPVLVIQITYPHAGSDLAFDQSHHPPPPIEAGHRGPFAAPADFGNDFSGVNVINSSDDKARAYPRLFSRRIGFDARDDGLIVDQAQIDADAARFFALFFSFDPFRRRDLKMRFVQFAKHTL